MSKTAIITGVGGMDGFYLSNLLLKLGYRVVGILRRSASPNDQRLRTLRGSPNFCTVYGDITDAASIGNIVASFKPDEFYHLAANSFVGCSWSSPAHVIETNTIGTINCLEAIKQYKRDCKFYFAGSSEMYGDHIKRRGGEIFLNEETPMIAASPYGVSKVAGYQMTKVYRESYDMFATCGILFNHSSALRGEEFFTRKVTSQLARIKWGLQTKIQLGNLFSKRDEGWSNDYVDAMHRIMQHKTPDDFVIATGETHSCEEWLDLCCNFFDLRQQSIVEIDRDLIRPNEVNVLVGDASKAKTLLKWTPTISFSSLAIKMCQYDLHFQSVEESYRRQADQLLF